MNQITNLEWYQLVQIPYLNSWQMMSDGDFAFDGNGLWWLIQRSAFAKA